MAYLLPLLAGILYGVGGLINKKVTGLVDNPTLSSLIFNIVSVLGASFLILFDLNNGGILLSVNWIDYGYLILSGLLTVFAFWGLFTSLRNIPVSEQILLSRVSVITYTLGG